MEIEIFDRNGKIQKKLYGVRKMFGKQGEMHHCERCNRIKIVESVKAKLLGCEQKLAESLTRALER